MKDKMRRVTKLVEEEVPFKDLKEGDLFRIYPGSDEDKEDPLVVHKAQSDARETKDSKARNDNENRNWIIECIEVREQKAKNDCDLIMEEVEKLCAAACDISDHIWGQRVKRSQDLLAWELQEAHNKESDKAIDREVNESKI